MIHWLTGPQRITAVCALLTLSFAGCNRTAPSAPPAQTVKQGPQIPSAVRSNDPKSDAQLISGFYGVEAGTWRWTKQQFSVVLGPPAGAAQKGAKLDLQLAIPDPVADRLKTVTLTAKIGATALMPESYSHAGRYTYTRDIAPNLLTGDQVRIDFQLDKALPPSGADSRQLGIIVSAVGLSAK